MQFKYKCIDPMGRSITGDISAEGLQEAKALLRGNGLTVLELNEAKESKGDFLKGGFFSKKINDTDQYNLFRELSILLKSGIKIDRALEIAINSSTKEDLKDALSKILRDVKAGSSLAKAFSDTGKFNLLSVTMIEAGESVGDIKSAFENMAEHKRFQIQFKSEIKNALAYPTFLIFASLITIIVIFKFITPRFFSIFGQNEASLPLTAKILYNIGNFFSLTNIYFIIAVIVGIIFLFRIKDTKRVLMNFYGYLTYLPLVGRLILYLELSRFSYSMYSMLNSGIEFINALRLSTMVIMDKKIRAAIEPTILQIKEGKGIAEVFSHISLLPDLVHNMLKVGEESGNLKEIFLEIHRVFDERFKNITKRILALVEPVVITITGLIVGFIVISLILTVMSAGTLKL
ncbi:MAG: type II secretion system F family protein [Thermodesulfovibrionales bacterium]|nr:type II secretion system F family protein [Thermodesulfovibrionales bacterium]